MATAEAAVAIAAVEIVVGIVAEIVDVAEGMEVEVEMAVAAAVVEVTETVGLAIPSYSQRSTQLGHPCSKQ